VDTASNVKAPSGDVHGYAFRPAVVKNLTCRQARYPDTSRRRTTGKRCKLSRSRPPRAHVRSLRSRPTDERSRSVLFDVVVDCTAHGRMKSLVADDVQHFETFELVAHRVFHFGEVQRNFALVQY